MADSRFDLPTVYATLVSKVNEIIANIKAKGISPDIEYMAWDSRGDTPELPNKDLIGVADWTWDEEDHFPTIEFSILVSVVHDKNLFREVEILNEIRRVCVHGTRPEYLVWTVRDANNQPFSQLGVTNFSVTPSGESEARTVRLCGITLKRVDHAK